MNFMTRIDPVANWIVVGDNTGYWDLRSYVQEHNAAVLRRLRCSCAPFAGLVVFVVAQGLVCSSRCTDDNSFNPETAGWF